MNELSDLKTLFNGQDTKKVKQLSLQGDSPPLLKPTLPKPALPFVNNLVQFIPTSQTKLASIVIGLSADNQELFSSSLSVIPPDLIQQKSNWQITNQTDASLSFYCQRWEQEIYHRFREAKKRFPEFFPCFELKPSITGLQYSIHFQPLTKHAEALISNNPFFPHHEEFKPIEQLWCNGQSELDILFASFPTQLALEPPKKVVLGLQWRENLLGFLKKIFVVKRIGLLAGNKV